MQQCIAGKPRAQYQLYQLYVDMMFHTALRITADHIAAQDAVQESFIKVFKSIRTFRGDSPIGSWMKRILINHTISEMRKKKKLKIVSSEYIPDVIAHSDDSTTYDVQAIHDVIQTLPDRARQVLSLHLFEEMTHREIASVMGITESTSKTQYKRAKSLIKSKLKQRKWID